MLYIKYFLFLVILLIMHYFLGNWWMIAGWSCLGVISAIWFRKARFPLLNIIVLEILAGVIFWVLFWNNNEQLSRFSNNSNTSIALWPLTTVAVNVVTAFLCAGTFLYLTKLINPPGRHK